MKLTVLGSGSLLSKARACSGFLVEAENKKAVVDLGSGAFLSLKKVTEPISISTVLFTHYHADHASDLAAFIAYKMIAQKYNLVRSVPQLNLLGPKGISEFVENLKVLFPSLKEAPFRILTKELENSFLMMPGFRIKTMQVQHENAIAYRLEADGKSIVFSGDSGYCGNLVSLASNADLLVADCSFPDSMPTSNHMTPAQCAALAKEANAKALLMTHFYPQVEAEPLEKIAKSIYDGKVYVAHDLMVLEF